MRKIKISLTIVENSLRISNGEASHNISFAPDSNILAATKLFCLFDNGTDVVYELDGKKFEPETGEPLSILQAAYNDCYDLLYEISIGVNAEIASFNSATPKKGDETTELQDAECAKSNKNASKDDGAIDGA